MSGGGRTCRPASDHRSDHRAVEGRCHGDAVHTRAQVPESLDRLLGSGNDDRVESEQKPCQGGCGRPDHETAACHGQVAPIEMCRHLLFEFVHRICHNGHRQSTTMKPVAACPWCQRTGQASRRPSHAGDRRQPELGEARVERSLQRLFERDLLGTDKGVGQPVAMLIASRRCHNRTVLR